MSTSGLEAKTEPVHVKDEPVETAKNVPSNPKKRKEREDTTVDASEEDDEGAKGAKRPRLNQTISYEDVRRKHAKALPDMTPIADVIVEALSIDQNPAVLLKTSGDFEVKIRENSAEYKIIHRICLELGDNASLLEFPLRQMLRTRVIGAKLYAVSRWAGDGYKFCFSK